MTPAFALRIESPVGPLTLGSDGAGLSLIWFDKKGKPPLDVQGLAPDTHVRAAARQLDEFFAGRRRGFELTLAATGTPFQREVWRALVTIPFGETRSYAQIAKLIGRAGAARAVGAANGANPLSIVVPCHRVIGADGSLTGYGGGMENKRTLLDWERAQVSPSLLDWRRGVR